MIRKKVFARLESLRNLPTLPAVLNRLMQAASDVNVDAGRIEAIIRDDPAMATRILKVVNSAAYSVSREIVSVRQAVVLLGILPVKNMAMMTSVFSVFKSKGDGCVFDREEFWRHSICTGIAAQVVYAHAQDRVESRFSPDTLHLCGLLHDIGKIVFETCFRDEFSEALALAAREQKALHQAEREVFGTDHAEVGAWIAERWKLSRNAVAVVRAHHDPESVDGDLRDLTRLCHTANHICNIKHLGNSGDNAASEYCPGVLKRLGLRVGHIQGIVREVTEAARQSETLMGFARE